MAWTNPGSSLRSFTGPAAVTVFTVTTWPRYWGTETQSTILGVERVGNQDSPVPGPGQLLTHCVNSRKSSHCIHGDDLIDRGIRPLPLKLFSGSEVCEIYSSCVCSLMYHFCRSVCSVIYPVLKIRVLLILLVLLPLHP